MKTILIDIDTLRADHLSCYGYQYPTTPNMDRLAEEGTLFENFFAPNIPTHPAHTTMYAGQHGVTHGIVAHGSLTSQLLPDTPWLPMLLKQAGIHTCAVDNLFDQKPWFAKGYVEYVNPISSTYLYRTEQVNQFVLPWLKQHAEDNFFLFLHLWDPHAPYLPPDQYREMHYAGVKNDPMNRSLEAWKSQPAYPFFRDKHLSLYGEFTDIDYVRALYDGEITYVDDQLGVLFDWLDELGIAEETLVILTADHGELMAEHIGSFDHAGFYEGNIHVPLIVRGPDVVAGRRESGFAQHLDLAPTVLESFNVPVPPDMEGKSLWPALRGNTWSGYEEIYLTEGTWQAKWGLRTDQWKFIKVVDPGVHGIDYDELYHISEDPEEKQDLVDTHPEVRDELELRLNRWRESKLGLRPDPVRVEAQNGVPAKQWIHSMLGLGEMTWEEWLDKHYR